MNIKHDDLLYVKNKFKKIIFPGTFDLDFDIVYFGFLKNSLRFKKHDASLSTMP